MRTIVPLFAALLLLHASLASAQSASATNTSLVGSWKSATDRLTLSTAFDESVWGKNAASERDVELTVPSTGPATLTVTRKVVDAKGKTVPGSTSIEQARLQITGAVAVGGTTPGLQGRRRLRRTPLSGSAGHHVGAHGSQGHPGLRDQR